MPFFPFSVVSLRPLVFIAVRNGPVTPTYGVALKGPSQWLKGAGTSTTTGGKQVSSYRPVGFVTKYLYVYSTISKIAKSDSTSGSPAEREQRFMGSYYEQAGTRADSLVPLSHAGHPAGRGIGRKFQQ